ncbi:MAG: FAD-dependent oxidoreductase [Cyclobacteriaceae bacterium]
MSNKKPISILGAGLVGSLFSLFLAKRGEKVQIFEKRSDPRKNDGNKGRSINLALSHRGLKALRAVGLEEKVMQLAIPMKGRMIHSEKGETHLQPYSRDEKCIYSVSRFELNKLLIETADKHHQINYQFNKKCLGIDEEEITFFDTKKQEIEKQKTDLVIGGDGANSIVRRRVNQLVKADFKETFLSHGYKELTIPAGKNGTWRLEKEALHIWPRQQFMLIALPNLDGSFTCTLFLAYKGQKSFDQLKTKEQVDHFFEKEFPDVKQLIPTLAEEFFQNPTSFLSTVKTAPWHYKEKYLLMGDAAHAIVPFYGQGMNAAFEDCLVMNELLDNCGDNWKEAMQAFSETRKKDGDAIAELALANFIEMRDKVIDPLFLKKKALIHELSEKEPEKWQPLYEMVTFSDLSYSEALQKGRDQDTELDKLIKT